MTTVRSFLQTKGKAIKAAAHLWISLFGSKKYPAIEGLASGQFASTNANVLILRAPISIVNQEQRKKHIKKEAKGQHRGAVNES